MSPSIRTCLIVAGLLCFTLFAGGCQLSQSVSTQSLLQHQAMIDVSGLKPTETAEPVKAYIAPPQKWDELAIKKSTLFTDAQWRSPSHMTAVGVAYVHLPLPLPARAIVWLAKQEYSKKSSDGKIVAEWTDSLGRPWFEAQNSLYHVRGYAVSKGWEAWIVYCGYKIAEPPSATDLGIAGRCLETILPTPFAPDGPPSSATTAVARIAPQP
jgi:hypothetical protein